MILRATICIGSRHSSLFMLDLSDLSCISHESCVADYRRNVPDGLSLREHSFEKGHCLRPGIIDAFG